MVEGVLTVISLDQYVRMQIFHGLPRIVTVWVPLPLNQVLKSTPHPKEAMVYDGLDLVFRVFCNEVRGWS